LKRLLVVGSLAIVTGSLTACASAPVRYYTLQSPAAATAAESETPVAFHIEVLPVGLPAQLDQSFLVVRQGDNGVAIRDTARWASPYEDELRQALSTELTHRLGTTDVGGLPTPKGTDVLRIKLQVRRFDAWPDRQVELEADWSLGFANDRERPSLTCHGTFSAPAKRGDTALVDAERGLVQALALRMAADARGLAYADRPSCSADRANERGRRS